MIFGAVNEQIVELTQRLHTELSDVDLVCECANPSYTGTIRLELTDFTRVERAKNAFFVLPGHEDSRIEEVIDRDRGFCVVRKRRRVIQAVS